jgi:riboflavin kinase/FMN adenylyltransferase
MRLIQDIQDIPDDARGSAIALGNFDGVHKGHQAVLAQAKASADDIGKTSGVNCPLSVLVFDPHPRDFFQLDGPSFHLTTLQTKCALLDQSGVDTVFALAFDKAFSQLSADQFITDILVKAFAVKHVIVGYDFCFGQGRQGDVMLLLKRGQELGFAVSIVAATAPKEGAAVYSSTLIRDHLRRGKPRDAAQLLGHWWTISGEVIQGDQRGRTIGFPTANISTENYIEPALGVYAIRAAIDEGPFAGTDGGVANLGRRPTFDKQDVLLEVNLFDFQEDIYGQTLNVSFLEYIRGEQKFDGLDALKAQIASDADVAAKCLNNDKYGANAPA